MPVILCATVIVSVGIGVLTAYAAVIGILYTFRTPQPQPAAQAQRVVMLTKAAHVGGD